MLTDVIWGLILVGSLGLGVVLGLGAVCVLLHFFGPYAPIWDKKVDHKGGPD